MKLWNSLGPNPRVVRMFLLEKGVEVPFEEVDIMAGENRQDAYLAKNSNGEMPCLELDDGSPITEVTAICEYLEERHPTPALLGATPEARAHTRMWTRRVDLNIVEPLTQGFRYAEGQPMFKGRRHLIPQAADDLKAIARENLAKLDGWIAGRDFVAGDAFSLADIHLYAFGPQPMDELAHGGPSGAAGGCLQGAPGTGRYAIAVDPAPRWSEGGMP